MPRIIKTDIIPTDMLRGEIMKVEKLTLKKIFIMILTAVSFLIVIGALGAPLLAYYKIGFSEGFYALYNKLCVEAASKSFLINGYAIPLCARCLGSYSGIFLTLVLYLENFKIQKNTYTILAAIGAIEIILEYFNLIFINNWVSFLAGGFVGIFLIIMFLRLEIKFKKEY